MNKQISPAELAIGMYVTVLENEPWVHESFLHESRTITTIDRSGVGDVLTILAIELPFVVVRKEVQTGKGYITSMDTRRTIFMELKQDYVDALLKI